MSNENPMQFEEAMQRLETLVNEMESGNLSLDQSMAKFQEATKLSKFCEEKLGEFEKKVEILVKDENGSHWEDFQDK